MKDKLQNKLKQQSGWSEKDLWDYFNGTLSPEKQHELEYNLSSSDFLQDAEEGLNAMKEKETIKRTVHHINHTLSRQIKKKSHNHKNPFSSLPLLIISTFLLLALIVLAFLVLYKLSLVK